MEVQVAGARDRLRKGEDSLEAFLVANRSVATSPVLQTTLGRITRSVDISRQWLQNLELQLAQAQYAEAQQVPTIGYVVPPTDPVLRDTRPLWISGGLAFLLLMLQVATWYYGRRALVPLVPESWMRTRALMTAVAREP